MATVKIFMDIRFEKSGSVYALKLVVNHKRTSYINLGISVTKEQWNGKEVIGTPKAKIYNAELKSKLLRAANVILRLTTSGEIRTLSQKELLYYIETNNTEPEPKQYQVVTHFQKYISGCKAKRTAEIYQETLTKLQSFSPQLTFEQLNFTWLKSFDKHLAKTCVTNTRAIHMRNIRAVFNDAINEEQVSISLYPFRKFKIKKEETIKRYLTADKLIQLRDYKVEPYQEKYRDLFMLQFYLVGISIVDLLNLKTITDGRIEYKRAKTGIKYSIEVLPEAMQIIDKYKGNDYLLDVLDTSTNYKDFAKQMNKALQSIGTLEWVNNKAKLKKFVKKNKKKITPLFPRLTTYYSRHSWATLAGSIDIPIETISAGLGHKYGSKVTTGYVFFDQRKVDKANREVLSLLKPLVGETN